MEWRECFDRQPRRYRVGNGCSFGVQHADLIFKTLELGTGNCFLDAGCGPGEYALLAAELVGETGAVIALDRDPYMIQQLQLAAKDSPATNISSLVAELGAPLPLQDRLADVCLISSVLHMPGLDDRWDVLFTELHRVLRHKGRLGIIESHKTGVSSDLPLHLRLTPETIATEIKPYGFEKRGLVDLSFSSLVLFEKY